MARPIRETPILYGAEARKFEMRMMNPPKLPAEQMTVAMKTLTTSFSLTHR